MKDVDHIAVMRNGSIIYQGGYKEVTESGVFSDSLELSQTNEDEPKRASSVSLNQLKEDDAVQRSSSSSVSIVNERIHKDNMSVVDDLKLSTPQENESGGVSNLNEESSLQKLSVSSECEADQRQVHGLKEEEENKRAGTVLLGLF